MPNATKPDVSALADLPAPAVEFADALFNDMAECVNLTVNLLDRLDNLRGVLAALTWNENDDDHYQALRAATHLDQIQRLFRVVSGLIESTPLGHDAAEGLPDRLDSWEGLRIRSEAREAVGIEAPFSWGWSHGASAWADVVDPPWPAEVVR